MSIKIKTGKNILDIDLIMPETDLPNNYIEISYYQSGSEGWGAGEGEYITKHDLKVISDGFRNIINGSIKDFFYECNKTEKRKPVLKISLTKEKMILSMIETLERQTYITVEGTDLSKYAETFFEWEKNFCTAQL
ncbi:MAG: hypothetical protein NC489_15755 [Ruminococcus flavefaciens]|nr:hypothetical protein [Ruminococcus flavefaciens]